MKKIKYLPLLTLVPLLFMGNSPAPYSYETSYVDFEVTNIVYGEKTEETYYDRYAMTFTVNNYGEKYLEPEFIFENTKDKEDYLAFMLRNANFGLLIPPHTSMSLEGYMKKVNEEDLFVSGYAFDMGKETTFDKASLVSVTPYYSSDYFSYDDGYTYNYNIEGVKHSDQYYYSMIVEYEYNGISCATLAYNLNEFSFSIYGEEKLKEEDIQIKSVRLLQGRDRYASFTNGMWIVIWVVIGVVLGIGFVASAIVVPIVLTSKKPWRKRPIEDESKGQSS